MTLTNRYRVGRTPLTRNVTVVLVAAALFCMVFLAANTATAAELSVRAPVVDVEPLTGPPTEIEHCAGKPAPGSTLGQLMAWDLGLSCRTERIASGTVTGYRVFYRWDDRVYSQIMATEPGDTVPLTVRLN